MQNRTAKTHGEKYAKTRNQQLKMPDDLTELSEGEMKRKHLIRRKNKKYKRMVFNAVMGLPLIEKIKSRSVLLVGLADVVRRIGKQPFFV